MESKLCSFNVYTIIYDIFCLHYLRLPSKQTTFLFLSAILSTSLKSPLPAAWPRLKKPVKTVARQELVCIVIFSYCYYCYYPS